MGSILLGCLVGFLAAGGMGFLFARNAYIGIQSGTVWAKSTQYRRDKQPILFWIALGLSAVMAAICLIGMVVAIVIFAFAGLRR